MLKHSQDKECNSKSEC